MSVPPIPGMPRFSQHRSQQVTNVFISLRSKPSLDIIIQFFAALCVGSARADECDVHWSKSSAVRAARFLDMSKRSIE